MLILLLQIQWKVCTVPLHQYIHIILVCRMHICMHDQDGKWILQKGREASCRQEREPRHQGRKPPQRENKLSEEENYYLAILSSPPLVHMDHNKSPYCCQLYVRKIKSLCQGVCNTATPPRIPVQMQMGRFKPLMRIPFCKKNTPPTKELYPLSMEMMNYVNDMGHHLTPSCQLKNFLQLVVV